MSQSNFFLIDFQSKDPELKKYNGRIALTLGWSPNWDEPFDERDITITPWITSEHDEFINANYPYFAAGVHHNTIWFHNPRPVTFQTDEPGYVHFIERIPVKKPTSRWVKAYSGGMERKAFTWSYGKWVHTGWDEKEEDE